MDKSTANETWIDKVIDELVDTKDDLIDARITSNQLYTLKEIVFNNVSLDYYGNGLRITNDSAILEYLRAIYPDSYDIALTRLKEAHKAELEDMAKNIKSKKNNKEGSANG